MVRFQPGGAGRNKYSCSNSPQHQRSQRSRRLHLQCALWRRHHGRAQEVQAVLPDRVLLLKALDEPVQKIAPVDPQAAVRLARSHMQLQVDERPDHNSLWFFSRCLLAEAAALPLLKTTPLKTPTQSPLKLKQMQGDQKTSSSTTTPETKAKTGSRSGQALHVLHFCGYIPRRGWRTRRLDVGIVAAETIANKTAR